MRSAAWIFLLSLCWCTLFLVVGISAGWVTITGSAPWLVNPAAFLYRYLGYSIVPFGFLFLLYAHSIRRLRRYLGDERAKRSEVTYYNRLLNETISSFPQVGVIWTAIGMLFALLQVFGIEGGAEATANLSAWALLEHLLNGGLVWALSTTVFGGGCFVVLRMSNIVFLGKAWDRFVLQEAKDYGKAGTA